MGVVYGACIVGVWSPHGGCGMMGVAYGGSRAHMVGVAWWVWHMEDQEPMIILCFWGN